MIFDHIRNCSQYRTLGKRFDQAFAFICSDPDFLAQADDQWRYLDGDKLFYKVTTFDHSLPIDSEYDYEYHKRYIDIHFLLSGRERIALADFSRLTVKDYDEAGDFGFANGGQKGYIDMEPNEFMICFPNDAHRPWLGEGVFQKVLFKIAIAE